MTDRSQTPYDLIAEFYDEDMAVNNPGRDIGFYRALAARARGPVLELGCGTGRITIPLLEDGCRVNAIDSSSAMLDRLRGKIANRFAATLQLRHTDMTLFEFTGSCGLVVCPFSAFTYVTSPEARRGLLNGIRRCLPPGGVFALDVFVPKYEVLARPDSYVYHDYRRPRADGTFLEREKTIVKDLSAQTDEVTRTYRVISSDGRTLRTVVARTRVRYHFQQELRLLLESHGFDIAEEGTDFEPPYRYDGSSMYFVCRRARQ